MSTFKKVFIFSLLLSTLFACNETSKDTAAEGEDANAQDDTDLVAVTDVVHNFYKWYYANTAALMKINFLKGGASTTIDDAKLDEYLGFVAQSGYVSQIYLESEKAALKELEATAWKNENVEEEPLSGLDYDRFLCSQDMEELQILTASPVTAEGLGTDKITATLDIENYVPKKLELVKENGKWLISKFVCE
jgi:protein involved in sex pheromone biosynthesis